ncbi:NADAR family protein [Enterobacillus tribolii]|uniref:N-glycosidase YbiA n=1 Tax=Enterobacillus tribolii TaxID=1487935 RepID=A0A370QGE7_9GAMM|nr:NADAR family protein [Enterobacillus tribolii]MBW7981758.1 NADAR family protein [Enterobacillus tribolii]RDK87441.1 hypothetical protein C8D90_10936 [Enterobacillus tribolii]
MHTRDALIREVERGQRFRYLMFWGHQPAKDGRITASCFSQWWPSAFVVDGERYATAEHWMMVQKARLFNDETMAVRILAAASPAQAKRLGREVSGFDAVRWEQQRFGLVCEGNWHKFSQHPELGEFLLATGKRVLVEASPVDRIWGIGLAADDVRAENPRLWNGLNLLGFALMQVRERLAS